MEDVDRPLLGLGAATPSTRRRHATRAPARSRVIQYALGSLFAFGALNAAVGGYYGLSGAKDVPTEWLAGSPFTDYFVPSLVLLVVVGGAFLVSAIAVFARWRSVRVFAYGAVALLLGWLAAQVAILGYVSWMQLATATAAVVMLILARWLPDPEDPRAACGAGGSGHES